MNIIKFVENYAKIFLFFNIFLILLFGGFLLYKKIATGYIFEKDISIRGGTLIIIPKRLGVSYEDVTKALEDFKDLKIYQTKDFIYIEAEKINITDFLNAINNKLNVKLKITDIQIQQYDPYFGKMVFNEFTKLVIVALFLIGFIIFLRIRHPVSTLAILLTILFDLLATSFILAITNFEISSIAFIAFLMILGYAIDNNIVLATNMFKEKGSFEEKVKLSLKIGYLMEITTLIVLIIVYLFIESSIIRELAFILSIALLFDAYFYLFGNVPLYKLLVFKD